jgi:hypothetical protein
MQASKRQTDSRRFDERHREMSVRERERVGREGDGCTQVDWAKQMGDKRVWMMRSDKQAAGTSVDMSQVERDCEMHT